MRIGDRVTCSDYPPDYPLVILAIVGGRLAIGSPLWPKGANYPVELHQITSVNDRPVEVPQRQSNPTKRRKAA
jgi:hypothetical protein